MRAAGLALLLSGCVQTDLGLFLPGKTEAYRLPDNRIPEAQLEEITIASTGEVTLAAFWAQQLGPAPAVLYLHGQGGNLDSFWPWVMALWDAGYDVLAIDYRGFGKSSGEPSEQGLYDDAQSALWHLQVQLAVPPERTLTYGYSLGTAVASWLALESPTAALLLEAPFTSMTEMIEQTAPYPMPADWATDVEMDTIGRIGSITMPLAVTLGDADVRVPPRMGRRVFRAAPEPKTLIEVPDVGHHDAFLSSPRRVLDAIGAIAPNVVPESR